MRDFRQSVIIIISPNLFIQIFCVEIERGVNLLDRLIDILFSSTLENFVNCSFECNQQEANDPRMVKAGLYIMLPGVMNY